MGIEDTPSWLIGLALAVVLPLLVEAGFRVHAVFAARRARGEDAAGGEGHMVSAALGLLGLLIGFTYAMSSERYDTRRHLVVEEANAISTTWLRAQLFDAPERVRLSAALKDYVRERQAFVAAGTDEAALDANWARTAALQDRIWAEVGAALATPAGAPLTTSMLQTTNQMFDLAASRRAAIDARVPQAVLFALIAFAAATAMVIGYGLAGGGRRHYVASTGLFLLVALAIAQIVDLDQPRTGAVKIEQGPMTRVAADILR